MTFGFVDRGGSSVELVWARDSAPRRDSSSSGFVWTPSRLLPFCCPHRGRRSRLHTAALHGKQHSVAAILWAMSQENVEAARRGVEAWNADDLDAFLAALDPEVEWHTALEQALEGRKSAYRGHDGLRKAWEEYRGEAWGGFTAQVQEIRDLGE